MSIKNDRPLTNLNRREKVKQSQQTEYQLIIIGGGITGAGIALDATLRGIKTLLVEKGDFASGTSSKSTKLIHGGLRYLKQFELGLVRESGLERAVAHNNIPHLVHPEQMLLPIVKKGTFGKFSASLAISVYDMLASVKGKDRKQVLSKTDVLEKEPILNPSLLKSGIAYSEYRTDDARLTIELMKAAQREGAEIFNYMQVEEFMYEDNRVAGVRCKDLIQDQELDFRAAQVVSAAGPWVDALREKNKSKQGKSLRLTKGVHIVVPRAKLPVSSAVYFDAFDGRMLFAIPRGKVTYIGTSDTEYNEDLDRVLCTRADAEYIIRAVNHMFEMPDLTLGDVESSWAGLRPLIHEDGKSPSELSRKDEIFISDTQLISIAGGKLTGFRKMAKRIVDLLLKKHPSFPQKECGTEDYNIQQASFSTYASYRRYRKEIEEKYADRKLSQYAAWYLVTTYGRPASMIIELALTYDLPIEQALLKAEIDYCIKYESAYRPEDYFIRRSGRLYFDSLSLKDTMELIVTTFADHYEWSKEESRSYLAKSRELLEDATVLK